MQTVEESGLMELPAKIDKFKNILTVEETVDDKFDDAIDTETLTIFFLLILLGSTFGFFGECIVFFFFKLFYSICIKHYGIEVPS